MSSEAASRCAPCTAAPSSTGRVVLVGLLGLAAAMGIGRFAFTPLLPLMQAGGLGVAESAWLASANYLGYLLGALACVAWRPAPQQAARWGLAAVAATTLLVGASHTLLAWLVLRALAGVASAFVLVGVSAWALAQLAASPHARAGTGWVYAGVGVGMVVAGLVALAIGHAAWPWQHGWLLLGLCAGAVTLLCWAPLGHGGVAPLPAAAASAHRRSAGWRLVACYGAFGFGYIIPATFLPALARQQVADPAVFGWTWPVFGLAAALSTVIGARLAARLTPRALWVLSQLMMAVGVLLPVFSVRLVALVGSAVCVGGSFMVATMAGLQEARRAAGADAPRLMAAMTAAFGTGQLIGPLGLGTAASLEQGLVAPSLLAAALLLLSSAALWFDPRRALDAPTLQPLRSIEK